MQGDLDLPPPEETDGAPPGGGGSLFLPRNPEYTGIEYSRRHPAQTDAILRMLAQGASISACARAFLCSRNTVACILRMQADEQARDPDGVEQSKTMDAADCRHLARLARDRAREVLLDEAASIGLKDLGVFAGIMDDKATMHRGDATVRVDVRFSVVGQDDYERQVAAAIREGGGISGQMGGGLGGGRDGGLGAGQGALGDGSGAGAAAPSAPWETGEGPGRTLEAEVREVTEGQD